MHWTRLEKIVLGAFLFWFACGLIFTLGRIGPGTVEAWARSALSASGMNQSMMSTNFVRPTISPLAASFFHLEASTGCFNIWLNAEFFDHF